jgi:hypothetical protein
MNTQIRSFNSILTITLLSTFLATSIRVTAQNADSTFLQKSNASIVKVIENDNKTKIELPHSSVEIIHRNDTVSTIILGNRRLDVIEEDNHKKIRMVHSYANLFKGHFAGFDLGFNNLVTSSFNTSYPVDAQFMEIDPGKSINVGINILQHSIPFSKSVGLVTGAALNISNYRFDNPYLLVRDNTTGNTVGQLVGEDDYKKNKLATTYLNIPLLFELQKKSACGKCNAFISAGGFVGFKMGSHTKTVTKDNKKDKNRENLNIRPYQMGLMARAGYGWFNCFASYNLSSLFQSDKGHELYPFSIGITLVSL